MKKALKKYILTLSILLLGGYGCLYSSSLQLQASPSPFTAFRLLEYCPGQSPVLHQTLHIRLLRPVTKETIRIDSENKEKEYSQFVPFRKFLEISTYFTSFYTCIHRSFFTSPKLQVPFTGLRSCFFLGRYLVLQVIRI